MKGKMDIAQRFFAEMSIDSAETRLAEELKKVGFGIMTRVSVKEKLAEKGIDFGREIVLLGVCKPDTAKKALDINDAIALMLPCSIVLYERGDRTEIAMARPTAISSFFDGDGLEEIAASVEYALKKAINAV